jgi:hypothetical protein
LPGIIIDSVFTAYRGADNQNIDKNKIVAAKSGGLILGIIN